MIPGIATLDPRDVGAGVFDHDALGNQGALGHRRVGSGLQRGGTAAAETRIGGDHEGRLGVDGAVAQGFSREAAEHHAVDGADAGAGEHGNGKFRDHRKVDDDPVALLDALLLEDVGELGDFLPQLAIGDRAGGVGGVALEVVGDLVGVRAFEVAIEAVVGNVQLAAFEPTDLCVGEVMVLHAIPLLEPVQSLLRLLSPESVGVIDGAAVHLLVLLHARDVCSLLEIVWDVEDLLDGFVCHSFLRCFGFIRQCFTPRDRGLSAKHT